MRGNLTILLAVSLLVLLGPARADDGPALKESSRLPEVKLKEAPRRLWDLPEGVEAAEEPQAVKAKIGREQVLLVDTDGNGRFDDLGTDGWRPLTAESPYLLPLEPKLVVSTDEVDWRIEDGTLRYRRVHIVLPRDRLQALLLLNDLRVRNGLVPVAPDRKLSDAAAKHLAYMRIHGMTHREDPALSGYSEEGARAGRESVLFAGPAPAAAAWYWCSGFHRFPVAHPDCRAFGIASDRSYTVWDGMSDRKRRRYRWPIVIPAPESTGHPVRLAQKEVPNAHPGCATAGCPVSVHFPEGSSVRKVVAELRRKNEKGPLVAVRLSTPEDPVTEDLPANDHSILLVPNTALASRARYHVRVSCVWNGKPLDLSWSFTTGRDILGR